MAYYYIPTDYRLVFFRSLHYYKPGLIILTSKLNVIAYNVSLTSASNTPPVQLRCHSLHDD